MIDDKQAGKLRGAADLVQIAQGSGCLQLALQLFQIHIGGGGQIQKLAGLRPAKREIQIQPRPRFQRGDLQLHAGDGVFVIGNLLDNLVDTVAQLAGLLVQALVKHGGKISPLLFGKQPAFFLIRGKRADCRGKFGLLLLQLVGLGNTRNGDGADAFIVLDVFRAFDLDAFLSHQVLQKSFLICKKPDERQFLHF